LAGFGALRPGPLKSSLNWVLQPAGGAGTFPATASAGLAVPRTAAAAATAQRRARRGPAVFLRRVKLVVTATTVRS
jgi:hypothetical protein